MAQTIPLTQGKVALVDDEDYAELSKYRWYAYKHRYTWYATRHSQRDPITHERYTIPMHSAIIGTPKGMSTDHINGDGLDNRRKNLRIVTHRENRQNLHIQKSSKYPGVIWEKCAGKWRARIRIDGKMHHLGLFIDEIQAAQAYINACQKLVGVLGDGE